MKNTCQKLIRIIFYFQHLDNLKLFHLIQLNVNIQKNQGETKTIKKTLLSLLNLRNSDKVNEQVAAKKQDYLDENSFHFL